MTALSGLVSRKNLPAVQPESPGALVDSCRRPAPISSTSVYSFWTPSASDTRNHHQTKNIGQGPPNPKYYCLLSTVYYLLSTVYCILSTVYCLLSIVYCLLSTVISRHTGGVVDYQHIGQS